MPVRTYESTATAGFMTGMLISLIFTIVFLVELKDANEPRFSKYKKDCIISGVSFIGCWLLAIMSHKMDISNRSRR